MGYPKPYKGDAQYVFVSYSHRDSDRVWPIISQFQADGYRVWYDEGIDPGTEWDENIAQHVSGCGCFIAVISANYLASANCMDELKFSRDLNKPQILLYLEQVELPRGMELRLGRQPGFNVDSGGYYRQKLYEMDGFNACHWGYRAPETEKEPEQKREIPPRTINPWTIATAVLAVLLVIVLCTRGENRGEQMQLPPETAELETATAEMTMAETTLPSQTVADEITETKPKETRPTNTEIMETEEQKIELLDIYFGTDGSLILQIDHEVSNPGNIWFNVDACNINGVACDSTKMIYRGFEDCISALDFSREMLDEAGLSDLQAVSDVYAIELVLSEYGTSHTSLQKSYFFEYYPQGNENTHFGEYPLQAGDQVLADIGGCQLILQELYYDEHKNLVTELVICNKTDEKIMGWNTFRKVNGFYINDFRTAWIRPGEWVTMRMVLEDWQLTQQDRVYSVDGDFGIYDVNRRWVAEEEYTFPQQPEAVMEDKEYVIASDDVIVCDNEDFLCAVVGMKRVDRNRKLQYYFMNRSDRNIDVVIQSGIAPDDIYDYSNIFDIDAGKEGYAVVTVPEYAKDSCYVFVEVKDTYTYETRATATCRFTANFISE